MAASTRIGSGILRPDIGRHKFTVDRVLPCPALQPFVETYWTVSWRLSPGERFVQETLPDPCANIALEHGASEFVGLLRSRFQRELQGSGRVYAIKFHPGGLYPFIQQDMVKFADVRMPAGALFDMDVQQVEHDVLDQPDVAAMGRACDRFLLDRLPAVDPNVAHVLEIVDVIHTHPTIKQLNDLAEQQCCAPRTIQRLFRRYVGLPPKWVIMRVRLQDAVDRIASDPAVSLAELANELGYTDQAHFSRDFRTVVGMPPATYARSNTDNFKG